MRRCGVWLPPVAPGSPAELNARLEKLYDPKTSRFPFHTPVGYNITDEEGAVLDGAVAAAAERAPIVETARGRDSPNCPASTYDGPDARVLGPLFGPNGAAAVGTGDAVVDLGAGIGKALAAAAIVSNASLIRGIELSESRFADGCKVLETLEREFDRTPGVAARGPKRRVELLHGDLFSMPKGFFADLPAQVVIYSYCNCFPYRLVAQIFRYAAELQRESVRLLVSKDLIKAADIPKALRASRRSSGPYLSAFYERRSPSVPKQAPSSSSLRGSVGRGLAL